MDQARQKCIDCAIQLCSSQGLDFTMSQLAAQLGMSKKTLYVLFDSKEALLLAVVDTMFDAVKADEAKILARQDLSLADKVRQLVVVLPDSYKNLDWSRLQGVEGKIPCGLWPHPPAAGIGMGAHAGTAAPGHGAGRTAPLPAGSAAGGGGGSHGTFSFQRCLAAGRHRLCAGPGRHDGSFDGRYPGKRR